MASMPPWKSIMYATEASISQGRPFSPAETPSLSTSMLQALLQDIYAASSDAADLSAELYDVRMNLFGPWPQKGENSTEPAEAPSSMEQQLSIAVSRLRERLANAREHSGVIRNRL